MSAPALPSGTVTFLFIDVEGSTRLWERFPDRMRSALPPRARLRDLEVHRLKGIACPERV